MKISTNARELKKLGACKNGYAVYFKAHGESETLLSQCLDSNGWDDIWWLISKTYSQFSEQQKYDLRVFGCKAALINIEKIKPYCSEGDYKLICNYLKNHKEAAVNSAVWSASEAAAWSAWSAEETTASAVKSAVKSAWSARAATASAVKSAAWSAKLAAEEAAEASARSAADAAVKSAVDSAASAAWSETMEKFKQELRSLFLKWESKQ